jgi:hypothetical protein
MQRPTSSHKPKSGKWVLSISPGAEDTKKFLIFCLPPQNSYAGHKNKGPQNREFFIFSPSGEGNETHVSEVMIFI